MVLRGSFPVTRDEATSRRGSLPAGAICRSLPYASDEICGSGSSCVTQGSPRRGGTTDHRDRAPFRVSPVLPVISGAEVIRVLANPAVRHAQIPCRLATGSSSIQRHCQRQGLSL